MKPRPAGAAASASARLPLLAAVSCVLVAAPGCAAFGSSSGGGQAGSGSALSTGEIVLTARGAKAILRGDTTSMTRATEDMFENLDIYLVGERTVDGGKRMRGEAGTSEVFVEFVPKSEDHLEVSVRVEETGPGSRGRWDRVAARGLLGELRRWTAR